MRSRLSLMIRESLPEHQSCHRDDMCMLESLELTKVAATNEYYPTLHSRGRISL